MTDLVRELHALEHADEESFGGKSTSLGRMIAGGINVPPGFAISTAAFEAFLHADALGRTIDERLRGLEASDIEAVNAASADVERLMRLAQLPDRVRSAVVASYASLADATGIPHPPVAVRSSARGEDSADATFAGQQETFLWVRGADRLCEAVRDCWISLYSAPAITYRARFGDPASAAMGVTVQLMVDAAISGVMFTCSPLTGDPSVVAINASWGLGLGVVGGDVTPDDFLVSKVTREVLRSTTAQKLVEYLPDAEGHGTRRVDVDVERQGVPCLTEHELPALVELGRSVERFFGGRQDIEWAIARTGSYPENLFALQARPVTATGTRATPAGAERAGASAISLVLGTFGVRAKER